MIHQINQANQILYFVLFCLSQRSGSPGITITSIFTEHRFMCFIFKDIKAGFVTVAPPNPFRFLNFRKLSVCCPVLYMHLSQHLYQSSSSREKTGRYIARPTAYLLNVMWSHGSTSLKAAPGTN